MNTIVLEGVGTRKELRNTMGMTLVQCLLAAYPYISEEELDVLDRKILLVLADKCEQPYMTFRNEQENCIRIHVKENRDKVANAILDLTTEGWLNVSDGVITVNKKAFDQIFVNRAISTDQVTCACKSYTEGRGHQAAN